MTGYAALALGVLIAGCAPRYVLERHEGPPPDAAARPDEPLGDTGPAPAPEPPRPADLESQPDDDVVRYETKTGDTLAALAEMYLGWDLLWRHLMEWNKLPAGPLDSLEPGRTLEIPLRFRVIAGDRARKAREPKRAAVFPPPAPAGPSRRPPERVHPVGERLEFDVKWYAITGGHASLTVEPMIEIDGRPHWHFKARAWSRILFFFKVDDWLESVCRVPDLIPRRFEKHLREGQYKKDLVATFDPARRTARWGDQEYYLAEDCRDLIGAFYWFRGYALPPPGGRMNICVHTDKTNYPMTVEVVANETVRVPAGEFRCVRIKPRMTFEGVFRQRGDVDIWLTDDAARVPVLVRSKVVILGRVDVVLTRMVRP